MTTNFYRYCMRWIYILIALAVFFIYQPYIGTNFAQTVYIDTMPVIQKTIVFLFIGISVYAYPYFIECFTQKHMIVNWHLNFRFQDTIYMSLITLLSIGFIVLLKMPVFALLLSCTLLKFFYLFCNSWLRAFGKPVFS